MQYHLNTSVCLISSIECCAITIIIVTLIMHVKSRSHQRQMLVRNTLKEELTVLQERRRILCRCRPLPRLLLLSCEIGDRIGHRYPSFYILEFLELMNVDKLGG